MRSSVFNTLRVYKPGAPGLDVAGAVGVPRPRRGVRGTAWLDGPVTALEAFVGVGTLVNVATIIVGSLIGLAVGGRLGVQTRSTITDVLGLITAVIAGLSIIPVTHPALNAAVGHQAGFTVILLALLIGAIIGSGLHIEDRLNGLGDTAKRYFTRDSGDRRFVDGFVTATLVFCVGPLAILGSLSDGLGRGADQLYVKAILDGFSAIAFARSLRGGDLLSAVAVAVYQGTLTLLGRLLGTVLTTAEIDALTVTGGIILLGLSIRLIGIKQIRVADLLPALVLAPVLVAVAGAL